VLHAFFLKLTQGLPVRGLCIAVSVEGSCVLFGVVPGEKRRDPVILVFRSGRVGAGACFMSRVVAACDAQLVWHDSERR